MEAALDEVIVVDGMPTAAAQDIVDEQARLWSETWVSEERKGTSPWRLRD